MYIIHGARPAFSLVENSADNLQAVSPGHARTVSSLADFLPGRTVSALLVSSRRAQ